MRSILPAIIISLFLFSSCSKERVIQTGDTSIVGHWESVAYYTPDVNGNYAWVSPNGWSERINFQSDGHFSVVTDVPSGSGTYSFLENGTVVTMHYEADQYGAADRTVLLQVEGMSGDELTLAAAGNTLQKTTYTKVD